MKLAESWLWGQPGHYYLQLYPKSWGLGIEVERDKGHAPWDCCPSKLWFKIQLGPFNAAWSHHRKPRDGSQLALA